MDNASADDAAPFGSTPGRLWLLKVPSALADAWSKAPPGTDLGSVEARDGGGLRLRPSSGPTKAYDLSKTTGAETRAFQAVPPLPKKRKADDPEPTADEKPDPTTGRILGRPAATLVPRPASGLGYRKVCRTRMVESLKSSRATRVVDPADVPRADKAPVVAFRPEKKEKKEPGAPGAQRKALPRATLRSRLFKIFGATADPLSLKEVNEKLGAEAQPDGFLKEVLAEVAGHVRVSGRVHYDLKPEYKDATRPPPAAEAAPMDEG